MAPHLTRARSDRFAGPVWTRCRNTSYALCERVCELVFVVCELGWGVGGGDFLSCRAGGAPPPGNRHKTMNNT